MEKLIQKLNEDYEICKKTHEGASKDFWAAKRELDRLERRLNAYQEAFRALKRLTEEEKTEDEI